MYTASYMIIVHSNQLFSYRVYLNKNELHRGLKMTLRVFNNKTFKADRVETKHAKMTRYLHTT